MVQFVGQSGLIENLVTNLHSLSVVPETVEQWQTWLLELAGQCTDETLQTRMVVQITQEEVVQHISLLARQILSISLSGPLLPNPTDKELTAFFDKIFSEFHNKIETLFQLRDCTWTCLSRKVGTGELKRFAKFHSCMIASNL